MEGEMIHYLSGISLYRASTLPRRLLYRFLPCLVPSTLTYPLRPAPHHHTPHIRTMKTESYHPIPSRLQTRLPLPFAQSRMRELIKGSPRTDIICKYIYQLEPCIIH